MVKESMCPIPVPWVEVDDVSLALPTPRRSIRQRLPPRHPIPSWPHGALVVDSEHRMVYPHGDRPPCADSVCHPPTRRGIGGHRRPRGIHAHAPPRHLADRMPCHCVASGHRVEAAGVGGQWLRILGDAHAWHRPCDRASPTGHECVPPSVVASLRSCRAISRRVGRDRLFLSARSREPSGSQTREHRRVEARRGGCSASLWTKSSRGRADRSRQWRAGQGWDRSGRVAPHGTGRLAPGACSQRPTSSDRCEERAGDGATIPHPPW